MSFTVSRHSGPAPPPLQPLAIAATAEGFAFVARTLDQWSLGTNAFDRPGEIFYLARSGDDVVGMCGLNRDPFLGPHTDIGRLRHLYVLPSMRRVGIGAGLVAACLESGALSFARIRLRTFDADADRFYLSVGFLRTDEPEATHSWTPVHKSASGPADLPTPPPQSRT